jgi:hypothetical protein
MSALALVEVPTHGPRAGMANGCLVAEQVVAVAHRGASSVRHGGQVMKRSTPSAAGRLPT